MVETYEIVKAERCVGEDVCTVAEFELSLEGIPSQGHLAGDCRQGHDLQQFTVWALEQLLSYYYRFASVWGDGGALILGSGGWLGPE